MDSTLQGPGWSKQAGRYRLTVSLRPDIAAAVDRHAAEVGLSPAQLVALFVGQEIARRQKER